MTQTIKQSPMMQQWQRCKSRAKGALLLFRCGDFYEAFYEDAAALSHHLDLTLTKRQDMPMAGVPVQTLDSTIERLLEKGLIVAVADQTQPAKEATGLISREITRIISPATHMEASLISKKRNNFFASVFQINQTIGVCFLDISLGEMFVFEVSSLAELVSQIAQRNPTEILLCDKFYRSNQSIFDDLKKQIGFRINTKEIWHFNHQQSTEVLTKHFHITSLDGFGLRGMVSAINAAGGLLIYLSSDLLVELGHIKSIEKLDLSRFISIDYSTSHSLDILESSSSHQSASLHHLLDQTRTPMGGRLFTRFLLQPLIDANEIDQRQNCVEELIHSRFNLKDLLSNIRDLERLTMRIQANIAGPRDLRALAESIKQFPLLYEKIEQLNSPLFSKIKEGWVDLSPLGKKIDDEIVDEPPLRFTEGGIFRRGVLKELDELREMRDHNHSYLAHYQMKLREDLDVKTLRVNFTKAFGYYIEVSKNQANKMPSQFIRRQTLVNAERFISPELKTYEEKILSAEERILEIEYHAFVRLREHVATHTTKILKISSQIALIDVLYSFAQIAIEKRFIRPKVNDSDQIEIIQGRHPVIESFMRDESFIPNDTHLDCEENQLILLTGPNMAGKSTYIRQIALLVIMAQMGSFIPAKSATIGIVDKIFSRIGANDDLARGQSTFMVEMIEAANILNNATKKSLIILDEIGRGTSTYDGISIALSIAEYLIEVIGAKTLFATHYLELTKLAEEHKRVKNFQVAVQENENGVVFLHKILPGMADKSYGIHVASLAGLPKSVIANAESHLKNFEKLKSHKPEKRPRYPTENSQMLLFMPQKNMTGLEKELKELELNELTPLEALQKLAEWKRTL